MYEEYMMEDADYCDCCFRNRRACFKNAIAEARKNGIKAGLIRPITLWPFPKKILNAAADRVKAFISVELSMGQMIEDVELATCCKRPVVLCNRVGGMIPEPEQILETINKLAGGKE